MPTFDLIDALAAINPWLLAHTVVSASMDEYGVLGPVGGIDSGAKLYAVVKHAEFPRITHIGMAAQQPGLTNSDDPTHNWRDHIDGRASPRFLAADSFADLVRGLRTNDYLRQGVRLEDFVGALRRSNERYRPLAEGQRQWLREAVADKMHASGESGYILLTMPPGWGKTAFIIDVIDRGQLDGAQVLSWHFARRGRQAVDNPGAQWDSAAMLAEQIEARLRLDLAMPLPCCRPPEKGACVREAAEKEQPPPECLRQLKQDPRRRINSPDYAKDVLHQVIFDAGKSLKPGQRILVCIDGLDEVFGALGAHSDDQNILPGLLPARGDLPKGVYILLTSRPGRHLNQWNTDASQFERIRLEENQGDPVWRQKQFDDIRSFLSAELDAAAQVRDLDPPDSALVERISSACEHSFYVAAWYVRHMQKIAGFKEMADPSGLLPQGLDGILRQDWNDVGIGWKGERAQTRCDALRALLGILAAAREAPSKSLLGEVLGTGTGRDFPKPCGAGRADVTKAITDLPRVGGFFDANLDDAGAALDWDHTGIPDWIMSPPSAADGVLPPFLSADEIRACHAVWLRACQRWTTLAPVPTTATPARLRRYALLWLPWHAVMAGDLSTAEDTLRDYPGWLYAGYQQALAEPTYAAQWPTAMLDGINAALAAREAERPRTTLTPDEYFRYLASCG